MSEHSFTPGPDTARAYRDALGCFGTGVTVVTTRTDAGPLAMTANSFTSVSLDPALVLWCLAKASPRHNAFITATHYTFHVMAKNQQPLATHFSQTGTEFAGIAWQPDATGTPILPGCLARFSCALRDVHDGGDHSIIVGQVMQASFRPGAGLMFKRGQYGGFAGLD